MTKEKAYPRFWRFLTYFTGFWILYGCYVLIKDVFIEDHFDRQPLYLIVMMTLMLLRSMQEYNKAKKLSSTNGS
ncbi:hypothetical protein LCL96_16240 [Rossellomorea aquimaris]|uniref:hypothetical protein n=1 Tax=Rossellomorea TaxID=2837508 RepID=UPI001CD5F1E8|nr:hypothetical protein [Rossellomorea aquimaris]MCA1060488.1 hypothetical protein [Rossellomorea aquimaris]